MSGNGPKISKISPNRWGKLQWEEIVEKKSLESEVEQRRDDA